MKVQSYVTASLSKLHLDTSKVAVDRMKAALHTVNVRGSDTMSDTTKRIIDSLCARLAIKVKAEDVPTKEPGIVQAPGVGKFEQALANGTDPNTGNSVVKVIFNAKEGRVGFYDPVSRSAYPSVVDSSAVQKV